MLEILLILGGIIILGTSKFKDDKPLAEVLRYDGLVRGLSNSFQVPRAIILGMIHTESHGDPQALGSAGERGLMQLKQGALTDVNNAGFDFTFDELFDPQTNITAGVVYLTLVRGRVGGDLNTAIRGYNRGASKATLDPTAGKDYLTRVLHNSLLYS